MVAEALNISGVTAAGTINNAPLSGDGSSTTFYREGTTDFGVAHDAMGAKHYSTSPVYLAAAKPA